MISRLLNLKAQILKLREEEEREETKEWQFSHIFLTFYTFFKNNDDHD